MVAGLLPHEAKSVSCSAAAVLGVMYAAFRAYPVRERLRAKFKPASALAGKVQPGSTDCTDLASPYAADAYHEMSPPVVVTP